MANLDSISTYSGSGATVCARSQPCGCGCGLLVTSGHRFTNQQHYDRSKGLPVEACEELLARFKSGVSVKNLAREYGVAHTTVYRLLKKKELR